MLAAPLPARRSRTARLVTGSLLATTLAATLTTALAPVPAAASPTLSATADSQGASSSYVCTFPVLGDVEVPLTLGLSVPPPTLTSGIPVAAGNLGYVQGVLDLPESVIDVLLAPHLVSGVRPIVSDARLLLGSTAVPFTLESLYPLMWGEPSVLPMMGEHLGFVPGLPGEVDLRMPASFTLGLIEAAGLPILSVPCRTKSGEVQAQPAPVTTVRVTKQKSSMKGRVLTKPVAKGKRPHVHVSVWDQVNRGAPGRVVAMVRGKQIGATALRGGAARLRLSKLPVGRWRVQLAYEGTQAIEGSARRVTVRVVKRRR